MEIKDKVIAMLIDAENVSYKKLESIIEKTYRYGKITVRRIYGDFTNPQMEKWSEELLKFSFRPVQNFKHTNSKNSSDIALVIDAMDILYSENVDCFVLVSSDSDFAGLASRIRERNLTVIGVGEKQKTSQALIKSCDIFEFIDDVDDDALKTEEKDTPDETLENILTLLSKAYRQAANEDDGWALLSRVGEACKKLDPSFDPKRVGGYRKLFEDDLLKRIYEMKVEEDGSTCSVRKLEKKN